MWTIAAPALAASSAEVAICSGDTGTAGFFPVVSADPVTAQVITIFRDMGSPVVWPAVIQGRAAGRARTHKATCWK
jgi:hypothetical protein